MLIVMSVGRLQRCRQDAAQTEDQYDQELPQPLPQAVSACAFLVAGQGQGGSSSRTHVDWLIADVSDYIM